MAKNGGGYTFIPREAVRRGKFPSLIHQIFKDRSRVLLRFQKKDGLQPFTLITQLPAYKNKKLGVLMHSFKGYTRPLNYKLGDYLYLGILPTSLARARTIQGFRYEYNYWFCELCLNQINSLVKTLYIYYLKTRHEWDIASEQNISWITSGIFTENPTISSGFLSIFIPKAFNSLHFFV